MLSSSYNGSPFIRRPAASIAEPFVLQAQLPPKIHSLFRASGVGAGFASVVLLLGFLSGGCEEIIRRCPFYRRDLLLPAASKIRGLARDIFPTVI